MKEHHLLGPEQVEQLRDDGAVLIGYLYHDGWHTDACGGSVIELVNTLAQRGHALPFVFNDEEAEAAWHERRRAFIAEHNAAEDPRSAAAVVPVRFTERQPEPLRGFYPTNDAGRNVVLRVHPDGRLSYAWELGQQAAEKCLERDAKRRTYTRDYTHHD